MANQPPVLDPTPYSDNLMSGLRSAGGFLNSLYARPEGLPGVRATGPVPSMYSPDGQPPHPQTLELIPPSDYRTPAQTTPQTDNSGSTVSSLLENLTGRQAPQAPQAPTTLPTQSATLQQSSPQRAPTQTSTGQGGQGGQSQYPTPQSVSAPAASAAPGRYVTNGGTSQLQGGYGANSLLSQWGLAKYFNQANPADMTTANAQNAVLQARNTPQYQQAYQQALKATGNPRLAVGQADALFATTDPTYAGNFINSGQDQKTQADFDAGIFRQNFGASIDPAAGAAAVKSGLPYWGTGIVGADSAGHDVLQTSNGTRTVAPPGTSWTGLSQVLTGKAPAAQKTSGEMTAYQQEQIQNGRDRNKQAQISNLNSQLNYANMTLSSLIKNGASQAQIEAQQNVIQRLNSQVMSATGAPQSATPVIVNTQGAGNGQ